MATKGDIMGTKINQTIWGTIPENDGNVRFGNSIATTIGDNNYNPETGNIDLSISPWGIGFSNAGNTSIMYATRTGGASSTSGNRIRRLETNGSNSLNTPFALVSNYNIWNGSTTSSTTWKNIIASQKLYGETKKSESNNYIVSDSNIDKNDYPPNCSTSTYSNSVGDMKPAVYLSYQDYKLCISAFSYVNLSTGSVTRINMTASAWNSFVSTVNAMDLNNFGLINIEYYQYARRHNAGSANSWAEQEYEAIQPLNKIPVNEIFRRFYFSKDSTSDYIQLRPRCRVGQFYPEVSTWSSNGGAMFPIEGRDFGASATYHSSSGGYQGYVTIWDNTPLRKSFGSYVDGGSWTFDDISYKTEGKYWQIVNSAFQEYHVNDVFSYSGTMYSAPITTITDTSYNTNAESVKALLLHEIAFYGFPFTWRPDSDSQTSSIGDTNVYVPEFDSHMITTGTYKKGVDALTLPNALWQNVFDDTIPTYDPTYNPPKPTPEDDEKDRGDLTNTTPRRYGTSGTKKFVMSAATVNSLQSYLNVTYVPSSADFTKDFKGTNPADYIVSVQRYPFPIPHISTGAHIVIGGLDTEISAYPLETDLIPAQKFYSFGEISIDPFYDDFRDYQSKITLIMPFIGSVDLDPRLYIGHTVGLEYNVDYDTGAVAAEIKRDGLTLETKTATISITIPFFAANMGSYQNALASTEFAIEQSKLKQIAGITSTALSTGGAIASGGMVSDTTQLGMAGGLLGGVTSMVGGLMQQQQLEYQLEHTAPAVGSVSVAAPANAFYLDDRARLIISRPQMLRGYNAQNYAHTVGNACAIAAPLNSFSGYTVAAACDLSGIAATAQEKKMIKQLLQSGVYV